MDFLSSLKYFFSKAFKNSILRKETIGFARLPKEPLCVETVCARVPVNLFEPEQNRCKRFWVSDVWGWGESAKYMPKLTKRPAIAGVTTCANLVRIIPIYVFVLM